MIVGVENLISWFKQNECPFWKLRNNVAAGQLMTELEGPENLTMALSEQKLRDCLSFFSSGMYSIECWKIEGQKRDRLHMRFQMPEIGNHNPYPVQQSHPAMNGLPMGATSMSEYVSQQVQLALDKKELADLRGKCHEYEKALKDVAPNALERIAGRFEPFLDIYLRSQLPASGNVAGTNQNRSESEVQQRVEKALEKLYERDNDIDITLEKLATLPDDKWKMARTMLYNS